MGKPEWLIEALRDFLLAKADREYLDRYREASRVGPEKPRKRRVDL